MPFSPPHPMFPSEHNLVHSFFFPRQHTEDWSELDAAQDDLEFLSGNALPERAI